MISPQRLYNNSLKAVNAVTSKLCILGESLESALRGAADSSRSGATARTGAADAFTRLAVPVRLRL